jgi:hypothetical protein
MQVRYVAFAALLLTVGCDRKAHEVRAAAAAKSAQEAEIDERSKVIAQGLIQKAQDDANKTRVAAARAQADARKQVHQAATDHPGNFLESSDLQVANDGKRHLTSVALLNKSPFSMSDIHGTADFHGAGSDGGSPGDVMAQVPIQLTGSIAPGASMVFNEQQHTLSGAGIRLPRDPVQVTFTITSARVGMEGIDSMTTNVAVDGGGAAAMTP